MPNRVVITSVGLSSSVGNSLSEMVEGLMSPPEFTPSSELPDVLTCPNPHFDLKAITGRNKNLRYLNRGAAFAVGAAFQAMKLAQLSETQKEGCGLFMGAGPNLDIEGEFPNLQEEGLDWEKVPALWILKFLPNTAASLTAQLLGLHGENFTLTTACSAGLQGIGEAFRKIKDGYLTHALAGAGDSRLSKSGLLAYKKSGALFFPDSSDQSYIPFSNVRKGFVPGEGGAMFLLEELDHALERGIPILGEICGYGASMDGYRMTAPDVKGIYAEKVVRAALLEAAVETDKVDLISAHGTGTQLNDEMEANMLERVFEKKSPLITSFKSRFGHLSAACGAMELAAVLTCLQSDQVPGIPHLETTCNSKLNIAKENRSLRANTVLLENFGFGGQNSALVVKRWSP